MEQARRLLSAALVAGAMVWCAAAARADDGISIAVPNAGLTTISDPNDALRYARGRIVAHDLQGAVYELERYLLNHPEEASVEQFLGDLYMSNGDLPDAEATYKDLLDNYPLNPELHNRLGRLYIIEKRTDDAIDQFQESLPDVESIYYLVMLHEEKGDLPAFEQQLRRYAAGHPKDFDAQMDAAQLFGAMYLSRDAAIEFQRALLLDPNSLEALEGLGMTQTAENADAAAAATLSRCIAIDASNYGCLYAMGTLDVQDRKYDEASSYLERAYQIAPESPEAIVGLARLADARGDWQDAIAWYNRALYVWPYSGDAYFGIAFDDEEHGLIDNAEAVSIKGIAVAPDDGRLHYILGYLYRTQGRRDLALAQFEDAERTLDPSLALYAKENVESLKSP